MQLALSLRITNRNAATVDQGPGDPGGPLVPTTASGFWNRDEQTTAPGSNQVPRMPVFAKHKQAHLFTNVSG